MNQRIDKWMGKNRQISHTKELTIITLEMWATLSELAFRGSHVGRGKGGNYMVEKPEKHH